MAQAHNRVGHKGRDLTFKLLNNWFYWPNLYEGVAYFVRSCIECQKYIQSLPKIPYSITWQAPHLRKFNLDCIHMPTGKLGYNYIVQAIKPIILWNEARKLKMLTARGVASFIYEDIICRFGCVPYLTIDRGSEFKGEVKYLLKSLYHCKVIISTPYHPQGNGIVERAHTPLVSSIFKICGDKKSHWPRYLTAALFASRVTVSLATGYSPYYLLYGVHPVFSFDLTEATWQTLDWDKVRTHEDLLAIRIQQLKHRL